MAVQEVSGPEASSPASFSNPAAHATQVLFEPFVRVTGRDITSYQDRGIITGIVRRTRITCDTSIVRDTFVRVTGRDITRRIRPRGIITGIVRRTRITCDKYCSRRWFVEQVVTSHVVSGPEASSPASFVVPHHMRHKYCSRHVGSWNRAWQHTSYQVQRHHHRQRSSYPHHMRHKYCSRHVGSWNRS